MQGGSSGLDRSEESGNQAVLGRASLRMGEEQSYGQSGLGFLRRGDSSATPRLKPLLVSGIGQAAAPRQ
jgi:hypothetical protein